MKLIDLSLNQVVSLSAINSMILANSLHQKLWESRPFLLKQLPGIGIVTAKVINFVIVM
jgi:hypothetical protein